MNHMIFIHKIIQIFVNTTYQSIRLIINLIIFIIIFVSQMDKIMEVSF